MEFCVFSGQIVAFVYNQSDPRSCAFLSDVAVLIDLSYYLCQFSVITNRPDGQNYKNKTQFVIIQFYFFYKAAIINIFILTVVQVATSIQTRSLVVTNQQFTSAAVYSEKANESTVHYLQHQTAHRHS